MKINYVAEGSVKWQGDHEEYFEEHSLLGPELQREIENALVLEGRYQVDDDEWLEYTCTQAAQDMLDGAIENAKTGFQGTKGEEWLRQTLHVWENSKPYTNFIRQRTNRGIRLLREYIEQTYGEE